MKEIKKEIKLAFKELAKNPELSSRMKKILPVLDRDDMIIDQNPRKLLGLIFTVFLTIPNINACQTTKLKELGRYAAKQLGFSLEEKEPSLKMASKKKNR